MSTTKIAIVFGSDSDWPVMEKAVKQLREFNVDAHVEVMSAHRNPARVVEFASGAEAAGFKVIISGAGMSNALTGMIAAHTCLPVIGIPLASGTLQGIDALMATVQMPPGVPAASVAIDGSRNAALFAIQILAGSDRDLASRYAEYKRGLVDQAVSRNQRIQEKL